MIRISPLTFVLLVAFARAMGRAQTNLDQSKSASQIFAAACADCHKAPRRLAVGKNSWALTEFLSRHYPTSRDQAAALAAYVIGRRDAVAAPATEQGRKLPRERAKQTEEASPGDIFRRIINPITRPEPRPTVAANRRKQPKTPEPSPEPAAAVAEPVRSVTSEPAEDTHEPAAAVAGPVRSVTSEPAADTDELAAARPRKEEVAAPVDTAPTETGETTPVPRDDIPD